MNIESDQQLNANLKYTLLLKTKTYEGQLKWLLVKRDNFTQFEIFKNVFRFFINLVCIAGTTLKRRYLHWSPLIVAF